MSNYYSLKESYCLIMKNKSQINQEDTLKTTITPASRASSLGGSDMGAILGLSPYRTAVDVWLEKTGQPTEPANSLPLRFGQFAESFIADEYALMTQKQLLHPQETYAHPDHPYMTGHLDRLVLDDAGLPIKILECKTANPFRQSGWGDIGSDEVPMSYLVQCQWYMMLTGLPETDLAVLLGNTDFRIYNIQADQELIQMLAYEAQQFWEQHVLCKTAPPPKKEADLRLLYPQSQTNKLREASASIVTLVEQYQVLNQQLKSVEEQCSEIKQSLMSYLGDAEVLQYHDKVLATWKSPKPSTRLDSQRLTKEHPELIAQYQTTVNNSRRLIIKELS